MQAVPGRGGRVKSPALADRLIGRSVDRSIALVAAGKSASVNL
jgi:hypothetical protein